MKIDLHVHTATGSDGALPVEDVMSEAAGRGIGLLSVTDHDSVAAQEKAIALAGEHGIGYVTGVELNVTFPYGGKDISLDFLGYGYAVDNQSLRDKLEMMRRHREERARGIMENLNREFAAEGIAPLTPEDFSAMQQGIDGALGRPHIAAYLIKKGIVADKQTAFDKYLVRCDIPKYPLSLAEASSLVRGAGGRLVLAHPNDPHGTSLVKITADLGEQTRIVAAEMRDFIDGIECWHSRAADATTAHYVDFCRSHGLIMTGGSDCHQKPVLLGTVDVPALVAGQFGF